MLRVLRKYDSFGQPVKLTYKDHGDSHKTASGGLVTILTYAILVVFIVLRVPLLGAGAFDLMPESEQSERPAYSVFGNLLPELAGLIIVGRFIMEGLVTPIAELNYRIAMIEYLFLARNKKVGDGVGALPKGDCCSCFACKCFSCFGCFSCP